MPCNTVPCYICDPPARELIGAARAEANAQDRGTTLRPHFVAPREHGANVFAHAVAAFRKNDKPLRVAERLSYIVA